MSAIKEEGYYVSLEEYRLLQLLKEYNIHEFEGARELRHCISSLGIMYMSSEEAGHIDRYTLQLASYFYGFAHRLEKLLCKR